MSCCHTYSSDQVLYYGPTLSCAGINTNDNLTVALQAIDQVICNSSGIPEAPETGLQYGRQNGEWTVINSETIPPVSGTVSGIVDNTALQELGGKDKLINNVRIGQGGGTGPFNTVLGENSFPVSTTADGNTAIGAETLYSNTTGRYNTALGTGALYSNTNSLNNVALGASALYYNTTGSRNIAVGTSSLLNNVSGTGNIAIGASAGQFVRGNYNIGIGYNALSAFTGVTGTGTNNIAIGFQSARGLTTGNNNLVLEYRTTGGLSTGSNNIILDPVGNTALSTGSNNVIIGFTSVTTNMSNTLILSINGAPRYLSDSTGLNTMPTQTIALITGDALGKSVITKEYLNNIVSTGTVASATATGTTGQIRTDSDYIYVCVATNTWKRSPLSTW